MRRRPKTSATLPETLLRRRPKNPATLPEKPCDPARKTPRPCPKNPATLPETPCDPARKACLSARNTPENP
ncbi:MAG: hypothetical protein MPK75_07100 [Alphaproteobacteria bacterium]|nr:hypothetical protein [Alphaproteobacteria bacterium]